MDFTATAQETGEKKTQIPAVLWCSEHGAGGVGTQQGTKPQAGQGLSRNGDTTPQAVTLSLLFK